MKPWRSLGAVLAFSLAASAQITAGLSDKLIHLVRMPPHTPVAVARVTSRGVPVEAESPFKAGPDWLRDISVAIKNTSPSKIIYVSVLVDLTDTGLGTRESPRVAAGNSVGRKPEHALYSATTGKLRSEVQAEPIDLEPGAELVMPIVSEKDYDNIKSLIEEKQDLSSVTRCEISVSTVYFADGTKWSSGAYWQPDAASPGRYAQLSVDDWAHAEQPR
jgi:hypothetical protein